jgi:EAL domain-containing protein (putative c-di-GMP-specific phosphodiesterase class I)
MSCPICEQVPTISDKAGELLLAPSLGHSFARIKAGLERDLGAERLYQYGQNVISIAVEDHGLAGMLRRLGDQLTEMEARDCPAMFLEAGEVFDPAMLGRMEYLQTLVGRAQSVWLAELIEAKRLEMHFQPIVEAANQERVFGYEALVRGRAADGSLVRPNELFGAARAAGMLFVLDREARVAAIRDAQRHDIDERVFINFNPTSIYDPGYCLRTTFAAAEEVGFAPHNLVFEVVESDQVEHPDHLLGILDEYRANGFQVALDDLGAGYGSLNLLNELQPDFVKLDMGLVRGVHRDSSRQSILTNLASMAADLNTRIIAEGVEEAAEADWLAAVGVDYLQGFYFARPASPPPRIASPGA